VSPLRAELYKLARQGLPKWLLGALVALAMVRGLIWPPDPDLPWAGLWSFHLVAAALIILTAVSVGQEFAAGTFRSLTSRGLPRWQFLLSKFAALVLVAGLLLVVTEGLATLLGVRPDLRSGELIRAWLALWPYAALILLLTVLARNGGLALVVGILILGLELFHGMLMAPLAAIPQAIPEAFRIFTHEGLSGSLYQWSLTYNSANWTYLAQWQRAPGIINLLLYVLPNPVAYSGLLLAAYTLAGLGGSMVLVYRRDMTEVVEGKARMWGQATRRARPDGKVQVRANRSSLPAFHTGWPLLVRLARAQLFKLRRSALVRIGALVSLFFPLALWGIGRALEASGFENLLFGLTPVQPAPLAFVVGLLVVGPLAAVVSALAVSNDLALGTRRAELVRGVRRPQAVIGQSLGLIFTLGGILSLTMLCIMLVGAAVAGSWYLAPAAITTIVGLLATVPYIAAVQVGGALTGGSWGALLFGLGFLVADWLALLAPTMALGRPGTVAELSSYSVSACTLALASGGQLPGIDFGWRFLEPAWAALLLLIYGFAGHILAIGIAQRRDA
jgi:ABC-type transport system involved in multi-copper enzyme maturation permease subunit